ncbi:sugar ABC transporter substrate-binding protein [Nocardioides alcanivorans]|uniref:sugar ABC transporter substrate-binding protein n=1 Tax=Nocardioides alcanivorans TaxID=2897352 RepID=UPI001F2AA02C|nr:substrate-binding domain-containing protein [Nocardioides alcanivorans]
MTLGFIVGLIGSACSEGDTQATAVDTGPRTDCAVEAKVRYEKAMAVPEFELPPAIDGSSLADKKFAYVGIISNSVVKQKFEAFKEAVESVGAEAILFDGKGRPDVITQAFGSAIAQKVSGIVTDGYDAAALVPTAVSDANSAGVPVVNANASDPSSPLPDGIAASVAPSVKLMGATQADYALAETNCKLNAITISTSGSQLVIDSAESFVEEVKSLCPDCKAEIEEANTATYATSLAPQLQSVLQRDPAINYIASAAGDNFVPYAIQATSALGREVPIASGEGSGLTDAVKGNSVASSVLWTPGEIMGYFSADAVLRAAVGEPVNVELPIRLVNSSNWGDGNVDGLFGDTNELKRRFKEEVWNGQP